VDSVWYRQLIRQLTPQSGFTLIEMVLVLTLLAILASVGAQVVAAGFDSYLTARTLSPLADKGHLAMERIMVALRGASYASLSQPTGSSSFQVINSSGQVVLFSLSQTLTDTLVMEVNGGGEKIVLAGVSSLQFIPSGGAVVALEMTLTGRGGSLSLPLQSSLYMGVP
jgi:prepilin-type N-terminal cleavage/methylation domain-containing protein